MGDVDSNTVLWGQTLLYTIYAVAIISIVGWFTYKVTRPRADKPVGTRLFWAFFGLLIVLGVSLHVVTYNTIPWVEHDVHGGSLQPDKTFAIVAEEHRFSLPESPLAIDCDDLVRFDVTSNDLTYGFGLFRADDSMVFQMQVVPGHANEVLWEFTRNGTYSIRSTEYSGPEGAEMGVPDAVVVSGCHDEAGTEAGSGS